MARSSTQNRVEKIWLAGVLAWLVPGMGHIFLGYRSRGVVICAAIIITFLLGLLLGSVEMVDPQNSRAWFCAQIFCGIPTIVTALIQNPNVMMGYGKGVDLGQVYTGLAGLLNLLCVLDALTRKPK